ncbi:MAG: BsaWI family type II restriction enzyme [Lachnospiraceae bacterium]
MPERVDYTAFCKKTYNDAWESAYLIESVGKKSETALNSARQTAQRKAIDKTLVESLLKYSDIISEDEIWREIAINHKLNVVGLSDFNISEELQSKVIERCLSAHQSWIKASGHSFERYISNINNDLLERNEIKFVLQSDLTKMIKDKTLSNTPEDISGLQSWGKDFDLYAIQRIHDSTYVFGCIQSKTSIRDRVGRDVTFSQNAMSGLFWSVAVTLDGNFLNMDEFRHMVNSGGSYRTNGWHGMYAMSGIEKDEGRIYKVNDSLDLFVNHAVQAARQFIADRRQLNANWKAE